MSRLIDIGANLTDGMYRGEYNGSQKHPPDLEAVLKRSWDNEVAKIIVTSGNLEEARASLDLVRMDERLFTTVGCHPTRCGDYDREDPDVYSQALLDLVKKNPDKVVAIGELGLDYDRLNFCPKEKQLEFFKKQIVDLVLPLGLPMFLHCRNAANDLLQVLAEHSSQGIAGGPRGVVHSFDGSLEDAERFMELGYFIGINGCSLKTDENLQVVEQLPVEKLMIETDAPWCEIRPSHAGFKHIITKMDARYPSVKRDKWKPGCMVKSRNEPCTVRQVLEVVAAVKEVPLDSLAEVIYNNTVHLFFPDDIS